jgi:hypothetical protein
MVRGGKVDVIFFGYIFCMGLSTGMSRQKCFKYLRQKYPKYLEIITNVTSPSDDIAVGRTSFKWGILGAEPRLPPALPGMTFWKKMQYSEIFYEDI